jgi:hypothetical protein
VYENPVGKGGFAAQPLDDKPPEVNPLATPAGVRMLRG